MDDSSAKGSTSTFKLTQMLTFTMDTLRPACLQQGLAQRGNMIRQTTIAGLLFTAAVFSPPGAAGSAEPEFTLTIRDHQFMPATLEVPVGQKIKLIVVNQDASDEEFESNDLHVEKIVSGGKTISVFIGPLEVGTYQFVGEFHEDTAKGTIVAK